MSACGDLNMTLCLTVGTTKDIQFTFLDTDGNPYDITTWDIDLHVRRTLASADAIITKAVGSGIDVATSGDEGIAIVTFDVVDTADYLSIAKPIECFWDIRREYDGDVKVYFRASQFLLMPKSTRIVGA
jgi:hypothetical protein